jgi:hypothetical protein
MDNDREAFWTPRGVEQLAADQGITEPQSLDRLIGAAPDLWVDDAEFDRFLSSIDRNRRERKSA